jgi:Putative prokaryotic signal transducing protein
MGRIDERLERQRLAELYDGMEKGELEEIAGDADSLTAVAREALRSEMLGRGTEAPSLSAGAAETSVKREAPSPVMIARFGGVPEALLAKSMLDSAGIESFLGDENLVRLDWFYSNLVGGIKLMVREEDAETARTLLEKNSSEKP